MPQYTPIVLTVDDDPAIVKLVNHKLSRWGYDTRSARSAEEMWASFEYAIPNTILLDVGLGDDDGVQLVVELRERFPDLPILMFTSNGDIEIAVQCIKNGAFDYICKPPDFDRLQTEVAKAIEHNRLSLRVRDLENREHRVSFHGMIGGCEPMQQIYQRIECVAPTDVAVLILGETGVGKEVTARAIHHCSARSTGPFIAVNCASFVSTLVDSALFGHAKGSFTGAVDDHVGYCEQAHGGTLFLDEIGEMPFEFQAKLLRFLQEHVIQPVGSPSERPVDVRVLAATNRDPHAEIRDKRLREDLYYRLNVVELNIPPVAQRHGDIPLLCNHFLEIAAEKHGREMRSIAPEAMHRLEGYAWPGNVRELQHLFEQIVVTTSGPILTESMLPAHVAAAGIPTPAPSHPEPVKAGGVTTIASMERQLLVDALCASNWNVQDTASALGIGQATVYRKIKKFGLSRPRPAAT